MPDEIPARNRMDRSMNAVAMFTFAMPHPITARILAGGAHDRQRGFVVADVESADRAALPPGSRKHFSHGD